MSRNKGHLRLLSCLASACVLPSVGAAQEDAPATRTARSPRNASYTIEAQLDVESRILTGREQITWRNTTEHATTELQFHLYFNAWLNERSSFLRAAVRGPAPPDLSRLGPDDWAFVDLQSVRLLPAAGSPAAVPELETEYIQPDDGNPDDRTVLRALLPEPVGPGEQVSVDVEWRLKVPQAISRAGVEGEYFLMGHWFPKLGVFEPDGTWNCHQFIQTEFYADFGVYDVTLDTPAGWVVGATGTLISEQTGDDGRSTRRYRAEDVQDFAWTTSPHFAVHREHFEKQGLPSVEIELLLLPDHARLRERYFESAKLALEHFGEWFGPYPWNRLTIVDPPSGTQTGGMEYPMFVTAESRWLTLPRNRLAEANTMHEIGHLWWFGAVANNEFEDAWLDEALNTWSHRRLLDEVYYPNRFEKRYFHGFVPVAFPSVETAQPTHGADAFDGARSRLRLEKLSTPSWRIDERTYYLVPYVKGSLMLVTLERLLGWETWRRVLRTYADRFWFRHPRPEDFFRVVEEVSGQDLAWFFDQVYAGSALFDYAVDRVSSAPARPTRGYRDLDEARGGPPGGGPPTADLTSPADSSPLFVSTIDVRRWQDGVFPVSVRITFADGSVAEEEWDGRSLWKRYRYETPSAVHTVEVDPDRTLVLDINSANNSWTSEPHGKRAALKWTAKWMIWVQSMMELAAGLA
jgi:hypothetical protein